MVDVLVHIGPGSPKEKSGSKPMMSTNNVDDNSQQHLQLDTEEIHDDLHYTIIQNSAEDIHKTSALLLASAFTLYVLLRP